MKTEVQNAISSTKDEINLLFDTGFVQQFQTYHSNAMTGITTLCQPDLYTKERRVATASKELNMKYSPKPRTLIAWLARRDGEFTSKATQSIGKNSQLSLASLIVYEIFFNTGLSGYWNALVHQELDVMYTACLDVCLDSYERASSTNIYCKDALMSRKLIVERVMRHQIKIISKSLLEEYRSPEERMNTRMKQLIKATTIGEQWQSVPKGTSICEEIIKFINRLSSVFIESICRVLADTITELTTNAREKFDSLSMHISTILNEAMCRSLFKCRFTYRYGQRTTSAESDAAICDKR